MIRSLWIAKTGLESQQTNMDVISNNLANVNTSGFKRSRAVFEDLMYQTIRQPGAQVGAANQLPSGLQIGTGVRTVATERIHTQGNLRETGNPLDIAIQGRGFIQVEMPDGTFAYTRDGSLQVDQNGQMVTAGGYPVQPPINIPDNALSVTIERDGTVSVTQPGAVGINVEVGQLQLSTFINPTGLQSMGENLYAETDASGPANFAQPGLDGAGLVLQNYVETSNVNVAEELVNMITTQRSYEMNSKAIQTSDQMLSRLTQL
ncbi:flagellar basal-body rod protein FlgG [Neopusillimonas maritima]|jgi:flagellar basal-body rod protein FlgG|uniref:Flagellar basal-body rod protein FlgG n=1 Tax=Neopusillimonas maritima TaxID=2026239 RepID=A0A3A1YV41_9BURK|nr:flagellar basal-body rod protein FlgG [Neopusillimonas maritima]MAL02553.1 flagellar basal-body rod protein FlgG [Alcaligenaceae bacterium]MBF23784.1 flagellar basal-body rod protein FlgG [Pusillimonas sp.]RII83973.1 flagellar basal-body rod protein FlgG [Neopusillimonas maritima]RIY39937.1 flagellar basal-body rod protein FlgG [Neopusillimonas maritima]|tara:strand:+ start:766 stop:1551 length:786 start_codon:yes stop_codon:yes gene_type:complete